VSAVQPSYEIEERVGRGGEGEIQRGRLADGRPIAVKTVRASRSTRERLAGEARLLAGLPRHRNVRGFLGVVERDDGEVHLLLEWVEGVSLATVLEAGRLPLHAALYIIREVLTALDECIHAAGVVHRDLSPANILIGTDGTIKVADFGIARELEGPATTGRVRGTLCYLSPEQARRDKPTTVSDLFAVGTLLYELLTGAPPFRGTDGEIQGQLIDAQPVTSARAFAGWVPPELDTVIGTLHAKDAEKRYQTAAEVLAVLPPVLYGQEALLLALKGLGVIPVPRSAAGASSEPGPARRMRVSRWRSLGLVAAGAVVASVVLVAADAYLGAETAATSAGTHEAMSSTAVDADQVSEETAAGKSTPSAHKDDPVRTPQENPPAQHSEPSPAPGRSGAVAEGKAANTSGQQMKRSNPVKRAHDELAHEADDRDMPAGRGAGAPDGEQEYDLPHGQLVTRGIRAGFQVSGSDDTKSPPAAVAEGEAP